MTSPIPRFDSFGNLDAGNLFAQGQTASIHHASLLQIKQRFVTDPVGSVSRNGIWDGWMRHRQAVSACGISFATLVNGSFCTEKLNPGDVDLCYVFEAEEFNKLAAADRAALTPLFDQAIVKSTYMCDAYFFFSYPFKHLAFPATVASYTYWTRVFGIDRNGRQKCILLVTDTGTL